MLPSGKQEIGLSLSGCPGSRSRRHAPVYDNTRLISFYQNGGSRQTGETSRHIPARCHACSRIDRTSAIWPKSAEMYLFFKRLVRSRRLELPRPFGHNDLNVARLPVPPRPHIDTDRRAVARLGRCAPLARRFPCCKQTLAVKSRALRKPGVTRVSSRIRRRPRGAGYR